MASIICIIRILYKLYSLVTEEDTRIEVVILNFVLFFFFGLAFYVFTLNRNLFTFQQKMF